MNTTNARPGTAQIPEEDRFTQSILTVFPRISRGAHMSTAKELAAKIKHTNSASLTVQKSQLRDTQAPLAKTKAQTRIPTHGLSRTDQFTERSHVSCSMADQ
jgi:hypothetical protein